MTTTTKNIGGRTAGRSGLHVINVSHAFGTHQILAGVSVFVEPGELVCLLGPSGCGKTTLLRVAAGLEELQVGQVIIGDEVVAEGRSGPQMPPEKRGVGLMFQDYALFPHLTVFENLVFGLGSKQQERRAWVEASLAEMGLADYADKYPHVLSGGQQQRVALLRALAPAPRVLFLDEPFSGLDVTRRSQIREQAFSVLKQADIAALMVTHDPEEAMFMADRILVMNEGRIVQSGTPVEIYFHPETTFVADLFGPVNRVTGPVIGGAVTTALGRFPAAGHTDGTTATVLIRPEGLTLGLSPKTADTTATVVTARPLGRSSHLTLRTGGDATELHARIPGVFLPAPGTSVGVSVDAAQAHVFQEDGTKPAADNDPEARQDLPAAE